MSNSPSTFFSNSSASPSNNVILSLKPDLSKFILACSIIFSLRSTVIIFASPFVEVENNIEEYPIAQPTSNIFLGFCTFNNTFSKSETSLWTIGTLYSAAYSSNSFNRPSLSFNVSLIYLSTSLLTILLKFFTP